MSSRSETIELPKMGDRILVLLAVVLFVFAAHRLVTYQPSYDGPGGLTSIGRVESDGPIRRRHAGSLAWSEIDGEGEIYLRDIVYTPSGVTAVVHMQDGRNVALPPDSLVQFDDITVSNLEITLKEIAEPKRQVFRLVPLPKARRSMTLPDPIYLEMQHAELMNRFVARSKQPMTLVPSRTVGRDPDFNLNRLPDYEIKLYFPNDSAALPYVRDGWTKMAWSNVPLPGVRYQIEMSLKEGFQKKVPYESRTNSLEIQFDKPGKYYWRVVASANGGIMASDVRTFTLFPRGRRDVAEDVTAKDFTKFMVEVAADEDFDPVLVTRGSNEPKCSKVGLPPGEYFCRVKRGQDRTVIRVFPFEVR